MPTSEFLKDSIWWGGEGEIEGRLLCAINSTIVVLMDAGTHITHLWFLVQPSTFRVDRYREKVTMSRKHTQQKCVYINKWVTIPNLSQTCITHAMVNEFRKCAYYNKYAIWSQCYDNCRCCICCIELITTLSELNGFFSTSLMIVWREVNTTILIKILLEVSSDTNHKCYYIGHAITIVSYHEITLKVEWQLHWLDYCPIKISTHHTVTDQSYNTHKCRLMQCIPFQK